MASTVGGKRARTRRAILLAAADLFERTRFEQVRVEHIADRADVSVGTIYGHFGSKESLALAYVESVFEHLEAAMAELRIEPSPVRRVIAAGDAYLAHVIKHPAATRMTGFGAAYLAGGGAGAGGSGEAGAGRLAGRQRAVLLQVAEDLKAAMDAGEIARAPIDETLIFVWGAWHGVASVVVRDDELAIPGETAARVLARGRAVILAGLSSRP